MTFDYCIINPPYNHSNGQGMLHYDFLCKALNTAGTVVSIQPDTWMNQDKLTNLPLAGRGAVIDIIRDSLFSNASLRYNLCVGCYTGKYKDITVNWGNGNSTRYPDIKMINTIDRYDILKDILDKGCTISDMKACRHAYTHTNGRTGDGPYHIHFPFPGKVRRPAELKGMWIVRLAHIIPEKPLNTGRLFTVNKPVVYQHDGLTDIPAVFFSFNTEREARNCYSYLSSGLISAFVIAYKTGTSAWKALYMIPWPGDFDTDPSRWTDDAVSDRAGLSAEERRWLADIRRPAAPHGAAGLNT